MVITQGSLPSLLACGLLTLVTLTLSQTASAQTSPLCRRVNDPRIRTIESFGAVGDGKTDAYTAMKAAAQWVVEQKGRTLLFGKDRTRNRYQIERYRLVEQSTQQLLNGVSNIRFRGASGSSIRCNDIKLLGCSPGTTLSSTARFVSDPLPIPEYGGKVAMKWQVTPLEFQDCRNFTVADLRLEGNIEQLTRSVPLQVHGSGVSLTRSRNGVFKRIHISGFSIDGMSIGVTYGVRTGPQVSDILVEDSTIEGNGRNNVSVLQARNLTFRRVVLRNAGHYANPNAVPLSPFTSLDVEPDFIDPDFPTENIRIEQSDLSGVKGPALWAGSYRGDAISRSRNVVVRNSTLSMAPGFREAGVVLGGDGHTIENSLLDLGHSYLEVNTPKGAATTLATAPKTTLRGNAIRAVSLGIYASNPENLHVEENDLTFVPDMPLPLQWNARAPLLSDVSRIAGNTFHLSAAFASSNPQPYARLGGPIVEGNRFLVEGALTDSVGIEYAANAVIQNEQYPSASSVAGGQRLLPLLLDDAGTRSIPLPSSGLFHHYAKQYRLSGPSVIRRGGCAGPFTLEGVSAQGMVAPMSVHRMMTKASSPAYPSVVIAHDAACSDARPFYTRVGMSRFTFYVRSNVLGTVTLRFATPEATSLPFAVNVVP